MARKRGKANFSKTETVVMAFRQKFAHRQGAFVLGSSGEFTSDPETAPLKIMNLAIMPEFFIFCCYVCR